jgi:uracil-DNA glycosylase
VSRLEEIHDEIVADPANVDFTTAGILPLYSASTTARVVVIGQAPGRRAQASGVPWDDASGTKLRDWMAVSPDEFYDSARIALIPMDFYYPGKGKGGDLPPRKDFAGRWHPRILAEMPDMRLTILIGGYAQKHYLGNRAGANLTQTVAAWRTYLPGTIPLVHPSPLNFRWQTNNPWFESDVVPELRMLVRAALD